VAATREDILRDSSKARILPIELVDVPEWGLEVYVRTFWGTERGIWEFPPLDLDGKRDPKKAYQFAISARERMVVLCACDEKGTRLFSDDDVAEVGRLNAVGLDRIFEAAMRLNAISVEAKEQVRKNSELILNGERSSPSPGSTLAPHANSLPASPVPS